LAHAIMEAEKICHLQAGGPGKLMVWLSSSPKAQELEVPMSEGRRRWGPSSSRERLHLFVLFRTPTHWMISTCISKNDLLTQFIDSSANLFWKHLHRHTRNKVLTAIWASISLVNWHIKLTIMYLVMNSLY
jgi:hypothetical protein